MQGTERVGQEAVSYTHLDVYKRQVLDKLTDLGQEAEVICCSSDPNSLDGVLFPAMKMCILDGTAPHVIEPSYWGAVEQILPLASCMDTALLHRQAPAVIAATDANKAMHARCRKFLGAAASLIGDSTRIAAACTDAVSYTHPMCLTPSGRVPSPARLSA